MLPLAQCERVLGNVVQEWMTLSVFVVGLERPAFTEGDACIISGGSR